jgi:hypothetical protein
MSWWVPAALAVSGFVVLIGGEPLAAGQPGVAVPEPITEGEPLPRPGTSGAPLPREPITESEPLPRPGVPAPPGTQAAPLPPIESVPGVPREIRPPGGIPAPPEAPDGTPHGTPQVHAVQDPHGHAPGKELDVVYVKTPPPGYQCYWFAHLGDLVPHCGCDEDCGECVMCRLRNAQGPRDVGWGYAPWTFGDTGHSHDQHDSRGAHGHDVFGALKQRSLLPPDYHGGAISPSYVDMLKKQGVLPGDFFAGMTTHHAADMMRRGLLPPGYRGGRVSGDYLEHLKRQGMLPPNFDTGRRKGRTANGHGGNGHGRNGHGGNGYGGNGHGRDGHADGFGDGYGDGFGDGLEPHDYLSQLKHHGMLSPGYPQGVGEVHPDDYMVQLRQQGLLPPDFHDSPDRVMELKRRGLLPPDYVPGQPQIYPQQYLYALAQQQLLPPGYQPPPPGPLPPGPAPVHAQRSILNYYVLRRRMENFESPSLAMYHQFPQFGAYTMAYETNPWYFDKRDGAVYAALGYGQPLAMPLAPTVHHTYNFGWGTPVSRLTPIWRNPDQHTR